MTGAILMVLGVIVLLIYMIIPELVNCIETFLNALPDLATYVSKNEYVQMVVSPKSLEKLRTMKWVLTLKK